MDVKYDQSVCIHAGKCVEGLPNVFKVVDGKFIVDVLGASEEEICAQVAKCPSGALTIEQ